MVCHNKINNLVAFYFSNGKFISFHFYDSFFKFSQSERNKITSLFNYFGIHILIQYINIVLGPG